MKKIASLKLPIFDISGKKTTKTVLLSENIFKQKINDKLIAQYVRVYLYNKRGWNASVKTRGEIQASTRKIYKQKGTGRARHGSISAPIFVGGGVVGGPQLKDKKLYINKKQKKAALFGVLTQTLNEDKIIILSDSCLKMPIKTKKIVDFINKMKISDLKLLFVYPNENSKNLIYSSRNIKNINSIFALSLNAYKVLNADRLIFVENALQIFQNHFDKK